MAKVISKQLAPSQMRFTDYAIIDNVPGFWIQHASDGFICGVPYEKDKDPEKAKVKRAKSLNVAQKICKALEQYDENDN